MKTPDNMPKDEMTLRLHKKRQQEPKLSSPVCYADSDEVREEFREKLPVREINKTIKAQKDQGKLRGDAT